MACWTDGSSLTMPGGKTIAGRRSPNVIGPAIRSDTYMSAMVAIRCWALTIGSGTGSSVIASRLIVASTQAPIASHAARSAMPTEIAIQTRRSSDGWAAAGGATEGTVG